ncbi:MAG: hypothetical protein KKF44_03740 [Nanoarchaeota archaeon]|nr:hypothetical protein [Nanoarchaeota archaeon]
MKNKIRFMLKFFFFSLIIYVIWIFLFSDIVNILVAYSTKVVLFLLGKNVGINIGDKIEYSYGGIKYLYGFSVSNIVPFLGLMLATEKVEKKIKIKYLLYGLLTLYLFYIMVALSVFFMVINNSWFAGVIFNFSKHLLNASLPFILWIIFIIKEKKEFF